MKQIPVLITFAALFALQPRPSSAGIPTPQYPDNPDPCAGCGGGDKIPTYADTARRDATECANRASDLSWLMPRVGQGRLVNGYVHFEFAVDYCPANIMKYNIRWSRNNLPVQTDMRWQTGTAKSQDYIINEVPAANDNYHFEVQSVGKTKGPTGYPITKFVETSFVAPAAPLKPPSKPLKVNESTTVQERGGAVPLADRWKSVPH